METVRLGLFGLGRGSAFYTSIEQNGGQLVAVCEKNESKIAAIKERYGDRVAVYRDFDEFIEHPMDAVMLCNYFTEHAPYAIRCLERGLHVLSETTSNITMAEGVALVRAKEKSGAMYMLAENYPYMTFNREMARIFQEGSLGKLLFAEGEYNHPTNPFNRQGLRNLRPSPEHWRNYLPASYYITHALAPLMNATDARPIRVTAMPIYCPPQGDDLFMMNCADRAAIIMTLNHDDSVFRVTGCAKFGAHENSYRLCGTRGQVENIRGENRILLRYNEWTVPDGGKEHDNYLPEERDRDGAKIAAAGHGGGDHLIIREFFDSLRTGIPHKFDVYFATTMASVAILAHRSLLARGVPYDIPDFHREEDCALYESDHLTPFPGAAGDSPTLPCCSHPDHRPTAWEMGIYEEE